MGLLKNLSLLFGDSLLGRMTELEQRQDLLEDYTDQKLESMKIYHARVAKRDRDLARGSRINDRQGGNGEGPARAENPRVAQLLARRARRSGHVVS